LILENKTLNRLSGPNQEKLLW